MKGTDSYDPVRNRAGMPKGRRRAPHTVVQKKRIDLRVDVPIFEILDEYAAGQNVTVNFLINTIIKRALGVTVKYRPAYKPLPIKKAVVGPGVKEPKIVEVEEEEFEEGFELAISAEMERKLGQYLSKEVRNVK